ncbi:hypothetical protein ACFFTK_01565 [Pseudonocardia petroleophila]|uniref:DUF998 domain-containing protein n=1 Tax=Pseudonocardia petroleophila TaxID=37331 RepID=A0A7G7MQZ4_9PSEU|nr:hypothetical protein [Pseudonocardia petroleophila]QNG55205.1 hypothetical protein H6H00_15900 [Pseudonocardia petroleophila]
MSIEKPETTPRTAPAVTAGPPVAVAVAGALIAVGGLLHPKGDPVAQLADPGWTPAHLALLAGLVVLLAGLSGVVRTRGAAWPSAVRAAALAVCGAAALGVVEMVPHLLAGGEAHAASHGGPTPLLELHQRIGLFSNLAVGLSIAVLAVLAARTRALGGGRVLAGAAVVGGAAFGLAAPLLVATGVEAFAVLFSGSVLIGLWLLASGLLLARRP